MASIHKKTGGICSICCEATKENMITLHKTRRQTHNLCNDCGTGFLNMHVKKSLSLLRLNISDLDKIRCINCPGTYHGELRNQCCKPINILHIKSITDSSLCQDLELIKTITKDKYKYLCPNPNCKEVIQVHPSDPILHTECLKCNYVWCRGCNKSPYHEGMSCLEYEACEKTTENGKYISEMVKAGNMKFCPKCRCPTEKVRNSNGNFIACNKIICENCDTKWCWLCGKDNIDYDHYRQGSSNRCASKLWEGVEIMGGVEMGGVEI